MTAAPTFQIAWPIMDAGVPARLVWTVVLDAAPAPGLPATAAGTCLALSASPVPGTLSHVSADLLHLDLPGALTATLRLRGAAPSPALELLYARTTLLPGNLPAGAADRPELQVLSWSSAASLVIRERGGRFVAGVTGRL